ncbi:hypothetical protein FEI17_26905 (plasmid) [Kosakonia radicincitans]|uniref:hypothetical protein n=1 Tax=Kosakonia radicincitans TaxID=283686 RepID=UPI0011EC1C9A|nr:hypothetical protein [Kosakonia radicincitans]QEM94269.1 hypothetical protein FEI17_26905 [Kosakonia radicincitans]
MQKLTRITLSSGEMAIYLDGWYLTSTEPGDRADGLDDMVTGLLRMPGMTLQDIDAPCPVQEDWCWNDVADDVFAPRQPDTEACTVAALTDRLSRYPADTLCCGTFWLREDFLALDASLTDEQIALAMNVAQKNHDANTGYNREYLRGAIEYVKG